MKDASFSLSLMRKGSYLECRVTRLPVESMMAPFLHQPLSPTLWKKINDSYRSLMRSASRATAQTFNKRLEEIGQDLGTLLNPIFEHFDLLDRKDLADLTLILDKHTIKLPWELAILDEESPSLLCERLNIGRVIDVESSVGFNDECKDKGKKRHHKAIIVGNNYKYSRKFRKLDYAEKDARAVASTLKRIGKSHNLTICSSKPLIGNSTSKSDIMQFIQSGVNFFHFSGHGRMRGRFSEIEINDHERISSDELLKSISEVGVPAPTFSFVNACETATQKCGRWEMYNWARAMADQGGRACIGTFWSVLDEDSTYFSRAFYRKFFKDNAKVGEAVRQARLRVKKGDENAIFTWPAFVLYGPPSLKVCDILI